MSKSWGTDFIIVNNVRQPLLAMNKTATGKPYIHLATVKRGFKEYMAYLDEQLNLVWIDEVDPKESFLLKKIEDNNEWADLRDFLWAAGLLLIDTNKEIAVSKHGITGMGI